MTLAKQLGTRSKHQTIGQNLSPELLNSFSDEQVGQLKELFDATKKPLESSSERWQNMLELALVFKSIWFFFCVKICRIITVTMCPR